MNVMFLLGATAWGRAVSLDIELVHPSLADGVVGPFEAVPWGGTRTAIGALVQQEDEPLVAFVNDDAAGALLESRTQADLAASFTTGAWTLRIDVPGAYQIGGADAIDNLDWTGTGYEDPAVTVLGRVAGGPAARLGIKAEAAFPLGTDAAWLGESAVRVGAAGLGEVHAGGMTLAGSAGLASRRPIDTPLVLSVGPEWTWSADARAAIGKGFGLDGGVLGRAPLGVGTTGAYPVEALAGATLAVGQARLQVGAGHGLTRGYGTTMWRVLAGVAWAWSPPPKTLDDLVVRSPEDEELPDLMIEAADTEETVDAPPVETVYVPAIPLATVVDDAIIIRDPIQFELGTAHILPVSLPTLAAVAQTVLDDPAIAHLLVEGHASDEGTYAYNYALSLARADAISRELIRRGVHPERLSIRGMGEVVPVAAGVDAEALAANRRVEFHIVRELGRGEAPPAERIGLVEPWTGGAP